MPKQTTDSFEDISPQQLQLYAQELRQLFDAEREARQETERVVKELEDANGQLQIEVEERKRAETQLRSLTSSLEQQVEERTRELTRLNDDLKREIGERRRAQQYIAQHERIRALGVMASGITHDFNNALSIIMGGSDLLMSEARKTKSSPKMDHYLQVVQTAARDAATVVKRLKDFYRADQAEAFKSVDLNRLIRDTVSLTEPRWLDQAQAGGTFIEVEMDLQPTEEVDCNESEVREALTNLILNAVDAMPDGGTLAIRSSLDDGHIVVEVADTGSGMTDEVRRRCLEPFFSTKGDDGSGMGLAIMQQHQGTIDIESEPGKGTTIEMRIPLKSEGKTATIDVEEAVPQEADSSKVLVVDDDPLVLMILAEYLRAEGKSVDTANGGADALGLFKDGDYDVVVTDWAMPEMNGLQLAEAVKDASSSTPVVMVSGFGDMAQVSGGKPPNVDVLLTKPVSRDELRSALNTAMAEAQTA